MVTIKSLKSFMQQPDDVLRDCHAGPVEISGGEQPYVIMTVDYLQRLLTDTALADTLDEIFACVKNKKDVPEEKIMGILEHE